MNNKHQKGQKPNKPGKKPKPGKFPWGPKVEKLTGQKRDEAKKEAVAAYAKSKKKKR